MVTKSRLESKVQLSDGSFRQSACNDPVIKARVDRLVGNIVSQPTVTGVSRIDDSTIEVYTTGPARQLETLCRQLFHDHFGCDIDGSRLS